MRVADLHLHTHHSDGIRSTREVVELASHHRLGIIAISDHDNLTAIDEATDAARAKGILVIPAVELSSDHQGIDVHLLGYAFDHHNQALLDRLAHFREKRRERGRRMVEKLIEHGCNITVERVLEICEGESLGRPHIARALVEGGTVKTIREAFDDWLRPGCPGFVEKERFAASEAIDIIHNAGGLVSVAHPSVYPDFEQVVEALFGAGADAVEAIHPEVDAVSRSRLAQMAAAHDRFITGGSDDHGFEDLRAIGTIRVPENTIRPILDRLASR